MYTYSLPPDPVDMHVINITTRGIYSIATSLWCVSAFVPIWGPSALPHSVSSH